MAGDKGCLEEDVELGGEEQMFEKPTDGKNLWDWGANNGPRLVRP